MERFRYDRSSKWLLDHHGDLILFLGHVRDIAEWRTRQAELVQPRKLPDGLLEVRRQHETRFHPYIVEIETYGERSTPRDLLDDLMFVYQDRHELPDVLILVLRPKGQVVVPDNITLQSDGGLTDLRASWRVVELWKVPASELLATGKPGLMPWVPLTRLDEPAPVILGECRRIIDEKAKPEEHANLLAVTQVLMGLVHHEAALYSIFGGKEAMIESPILKELIDEKVAQRVAEIFEGKQPMIESPILKELIDQKVAHKVAEAMQKSVLRMLGDRFGPVPPDVSQRIGDVTNTDQLVQLGSQAARCPDLETFRRHLGA
jgi:hypothetical protein